MNEQNSVSPTNENSVRDVAAVVDKFISECEKLVENATEQMPREQRASYHRDMVAAQWIFEELDRLETQAPKPWATDSNVLFILVTITIGLIGLVLSVFPFFENLSSEINRRSVYLFLIIAPVLLATYLDIGMAEVRKITNNQTIEMLWERWHSLGLPLNVLNDALPSGKYKEQFERAERKKYSLEKDDRELWVLNRKEFDICVTQILINQLGFTGIDRFSDLRWRFVEIRKQIRGKSAGKADKSV